MKKRFNSRITTSGLPLNEVNLFRQLSDELNTRFSSSTFISETHGRKGFIEYQSRIKGGRKVVEISDLLIITYNKMKHEFRINFLQAKYKKTPYKNFISFRGNVYQRELLAEKPDIMDIHSLGFHRNILNFTNYMSITAYGIFYVDTSGEIDFLYTMPEYLFPKNLHTKTGITNFYFSRGSYCPYLRCTYGMMHDETISTCSLNIFTSELLAGRIGAPLDHMYIPYVSRKITSMLSFNPNNVVLSQLNEILKEYGQDREYESNIAGMNYSDYYPNTLIVITDGNRIDEEIY